MEMERGPSHHPVGGSCRDIIAQDFMYVWGGWYEQAFRTAQCVKAHQLCTEHNT